MVITIKGRIRIEKTVTDVPFQCRGCHKQVSKGDYCWKISLKDKELFSICTECNGPTEDMLQIEEYIINNEDLLHYEPPIGYQRISNNTRDQYHKAVKYYSEGNFEECIKILGGIGKMLTDMAFENIVGAASDGEYEKEYDTWGDRLYKLLNHQEVKGSIVLKAVFHLLRALKDLRNIEAHKDDLDFIRETDGNFEFQKIDARVALVIIQFAVDRLYGCGILPSPEK